MPRLNVLQRFTPKSSFGRKSTVLLRPSIVVGEYEPFPNDDPTGLASILGQPPGARNGVEQQERYTRDQVAILVERGHTVVVAQVDDAIEQAEAAKLAASSSNPADRPEVKKMIADGYARGRASRGSIWR